MGGWGEGEGVRGAGGGRGRGRDEGGQKWGAAGVGPGSERM